MKSSKSKKYMVAIFSTEMEVLHTDLDKLSALVVINDLIDNGEDLERIFLFEVKQVPLKMELKIG